MINSVNDRQAIQYTAKLPAKSNDGTSFGDLLNAKNGNLTTHKGHGGHDQTVVGGASDKIWISEPDIHKIIPENLLDDKSDKMWELPQAPQEPTDPGKIVEEWIQVTVVNEDGTISDGSEDFEILVRTPITAFIDSE